MILMENLSVTFNMGFTRPRSVQGFFFWAQRGDLCTPALCVSLGNSGFRPRSVCSAGNGVFVVNVSRFIRTALADNDCDLGMLRAWLG